MTSSDWANKDFYKVLGVGKDASADDIKKAYRKLARANHPDSHPGDKAAEERFKAIAEAYDVIGDQEKRKQYDEMRSAFAGGFGPFTTTGGGPGGPGGTTFDVNDLFGGRRRRGRRLRRPLRDHVRWRWGWRRADDPHPGPSRRRHRDRGDHRIRRRRRRRHRLAAAQLRCSVPGLLGHRGAVRHRAAGLSRVRGRRHARRVGGRRVHDERDLPGLRWPRPRRRRPVPDLPRLRPRSVQPHHLGADPGRGQGRPADPAARQGRERRARRASGRPLRHRARRRRTRCSGGAATT